MASSLGGLTVSREPPPPPSSSTPPRRRHPGRVLTLVLIAAVGSMAWLLRDRLIPAVPVTVAAVLAGPGAGSGAGSSESIPGQVAAPASTVLARASGWLAPDPHPITVSAQRAGTVQGLYVRSGQLVAAGEALADLDPRDADLAVQRAEAALATTRAAVQQTEAARQRRQAELAAADARLAQATDRSHRLVRSGAGVSDNDRSQAVLETATRAAERAVAEAAVAEADAAILAAHGVVQAAETERAIALLDRERCHITAPVAGIVLRVTAVPGQRLSLEDSGTARIVELFDPSAVQVRADIALGDAGRVQPQQRVELEFDLLPGRTLTGRVTGLAGEADAARNTLQAHIAIDNPPAGLRPDMLARVRIFGEADSTLTATNSATNSATHSASHLLVPSAGLHARTPTGAEVWMVDIDQRVRRRAIVPAGAEHNGWTPIARFDQQTRYAIVYLSPSPAAK